MKSSAISFLLSSQNPDGGWGYASRQGSAVEPTSAVLLALREISACARSCRLAIDWLRSAQHPDGGWGFSSIDSESGWPTAWAVLVLARCGEVDNALNQGVKWLLDVKAAQFDEDARQVGKKILAIDFSLRGWPWLSGEATWIEPTALALLALESIPGLAYTDRRNEAQRYIQDRRCPSGGWNVGNPIMFHSALPAQAYSTAMVLLALRRLAPESILSEDIRVLRAEMHRDGSVLALAWGLLALRTLGQDDTSAESRLVSMANQRRGWADNPFQTAVALMALRGNL